MPVPSFGRSGKTLAVRLAAQREAQRTGQPALILHPDRIESIQPDGTSTEQATPDALIQGVEGRVIGVDLGTGPGGDFATAVTMHREPGGAMIIDEVVRVSPGEAEPLWPKRYTALGLKPAAFTSFPWRAEHLQQPMRKVQGGEEPVVDVVRPTYGRPTLDMRGDEIIDWHGKPLDVADLESAAEKIAAKPLSPNIYYDMAGHEVPQNTGNIIAQETVRGTEILLGMFETALLRSVEESFGLKYGRGRDAVRRTVKRFTIDHAVNDTGQLVGGPCVCCGGNTRTKTGYLNGLKLKAPVFAHMTCEATRVEQPRDLVAQLHAPAVSADPDQVMPRKRHRARRWLLEQLRSPRVAR